MANEEEGITMAISSTISESNSMVSATMGRIMTTLLGTRTKKLTDAISRLDYAPKIIPHAVSLEDSLWILYKYVKDSVDKELFCLDHVLVPMIEHSLKCKDLERHNQTLILLDWLLQDDDVFEALATNYASVFLRKDDHYIAFGWCIVTRSLVEDDKLKEKFQTSGAEKYDKLLRILSSCVKHLLVLCSGSIFQGDYELPTRLSVAAADCIIALTIALTRKDMDSDIAENTGKSVKAHSPSQLTSLRRPGSCGSLKNVKPISTSQEISTRTEIGLILWDLLDEVTVLVQKLNAWSKKSRYLHAKGLERLLNWLLKTKHHYSCFQDLQIVKAGAMLFSSCWKHCSVLLHLEDRKFSQYYTELLDQYISGIQFYADNDELKDNKDSGIETVNFFLSCILLLLGRCNDKQFESAMAERGLQMSHLFISQLHSVDGDVIDGAVCLIKAVMFKTNSSSSASHLADTRHLDAIFPSLLHLLDGNDGAAKAAVTLVTEFCLLSSNKHCLEKVLELLAAGNISQRKNAFEVIFELIHTSLDSVADLSHLSWQDISNHLLQSLRDEESVISTQSSKLLSLIDPLITLPPLVHLVYSDEAVRSSACNTISTVLKHHNKRFDVICSLLDCLSTLCGSLDRPDTCTDIKQGSNLDAERVLKLIPEWSKSVEDWKNLVGPLVDKMLEEPSNVIIVRFLSYVSENLADAADVVFQQLMSHARAMKGILVREESVQPNHSLFDNLCPLLIIRLLPLRVFDDLQSCSVYGALLERNMMQDYRYFESNDTECVATLLLNRAFNRLEYEDVRKLAAELCGRIHHHVLYPIISSQMEDAASSNDVVTLKACLFAICTSLMARGMFSIVHPSMVKIREVIENVLLWPSTDGDEVSKAQHGCIDCLALMVCTELQNPKSLQTSCVDTIQVIENGTSSDNASSGIAIHTYVIRQLTCNTNEFITASNIVEKHMLEAALVRSFRLCMANVLISACQKISGSGRKSFAQTILPPIICSVGVLCNPEIRAACIQILFSAVYHLKSDIYPYSKDLLKVAVTSLREGSEKEKMAGAKLMTALLASDDSVVQSLSAELLAARNLLSSIASSDASSDLRLVCQKLLLCMTFH